MFPIKHLVLSELHLEIWVREVSENSVLKLKAITIQNKVCVCVCV